MTSAVRILAGPKAVALGAILAAVLFVSNVTAVVPQAERTIYVSAVGQNGMPVMDLQPTDFAVKEDNLVREIKKVGKAEEPVYYAVLVDTALGSSGSAQGDTNNLLPYMRDALTGFVKLVFTAAPPESKILMMEFGSAAIVRQPFTTAVAELETLIPKMIPKTGEPVLNEALVEAAKQLSKVPTRRRVILSVNREPTPEASTLDGKLVAEEVRKSGASVWGISVRYGTRQDANRENLLKGLAINSGGMRLTLQTPVPLPDYLRSVAANTIVQYAITIARPADAPPTKMTAVTVTRPGVTVLTQLWSDK